MSKSVPDILCNIEVHQYYPTTPSRSKCHSDKDYEIKMNRYNKSQFYRCKNPSYDVVSYVTRPDAINNIEKSQIENILDIEQKSSYQSSDIFEYANARPGSTGAFNEFGDISNSEVKEKLRNTQSNIWSGVLSFTESYGNLYCNNKKQAQELINHSLKKLFNSQGLSPDNVEYFCALHTNTDNAHIHFIYWEKEPLKLKANGDRTYSNFMVPKKAINDFIYAVFDYNKNLNLKNNTNQYFTYRDVVRDAFKANKIEDTNLQRWLKLDSDLGQRNTKQYARLTKEQRSIISQFVDEFVKAIPSLKENWDKYHEGVLKKFNEIKKAHADLKIPLSKAAKTFYKSRMDELYNRCGNEVLKSLNLIVNMHNSNEEKLKEKLTKKSSNNKNQTFKKTVKGSSQNKRLLKDLLSALMKEQTDVINKNINTALKEFYTELEEKGDIAIYEL